MDVQLAQPLGYSEPGGRSNNEDSLFPDPQTVSSGQKWFMVCDGVGGAERGEVASRLAVVSLDTFLQRHPVSVVTPDYIQQAIGYAESQFNVYLTDNPQAAGMATTLTLLYVHEAGVMVAHIGDSRVYHVRDGRIIWRTEDHSYVAELVKSGVLNLEEAHRHPQRNVITRALQGGTKPTQASMHTITDLRPGDYFFLCSDGVLERVSDYVLADALGDRATSNAQKIAQLRAVSMGNTRDNFTAYLIQVGQVLGHSAVSQPMQTTYTSEAHTANEEDTDEAITLINAPIPDDVRADVSAPRPSRLTPTESARISPTAAVTPGSPAPSSPAWAVLHPSSQSAGMKPRRSGSRWTILFVALIGALVGAGGFLAWQKLSKPIDKETTVITESAITALPPSDSPPTPTGHPGAQDDERATTNQSETESEVELTVLPDRKAETGPDRTSERRTRYEVIRRVDNQLMVVRDPQTRRLRLQKVNGEPVTDFSYDGIGSFKNGVANVDATDGRAAYLAKDGRRFTSFSVYKDGIATLTDLNGKSHYLSQGGKWLDEVKSSSNGKVAVRKDNRWGYLNLQGQVAIFLQYDRAEPFTDDGTAEVSLNGHTFRINKKGERTADGDEAEKTGKKGKHSFRRDT